MATNNGVGLQIEGLDRLLKKLGAIPNNVATQVDAEMAATANEFVNNAVAAAPVSMGILKNEITYSQLKQMQYEIVSGAGYSAYLEFGTIEKVSVPGELQDYAMQFKGKGLKKTGGIYPHPFFFPQLPIARAQINQRLQAVVKAALSK